MSIAGWRRDSSPIWRPLCSACNRSSTACCTASEVSVGTPTGAGARLEPAVFLQPGDVVEVEAEGIGKLVNGVEDET